MPRLWKPCPFPALALVFLGGVGMTALLSIRLPSMREQGLPFYGSMLTALVFATLVERLRRQPNTCPWLDFGQASRLILYVALFIIAIVVALPGMWPASDVEWPLRIPAVLLAIAFPALLAIHLKVDHSELEESGVKRSLVFASRLPVYFLCVVVALVFLGGVLTLVGVLR